MKNVVKLRKAVREMNKGETLYINVIGTSVKFVDQLREYVKAGVLTPEYSEVEKKYKDVEAVMSGNTILPQMIYIKN